MLYCPNFFWNVLQVWMTGKDVYLQMTWSWPDKTWNILCSYCLQWNTSQSKFRNHYFLFLFAFSILSQLFLIWGCIFEKFFECLSSFVIYFSHASKKLVERKVERRGIAQWLTGNETTSIPTSFTLSELHQYSRQVKSDHNRWEFDITLLR